MEGALGAAKQARGSARKVKAEGGAPSPAGAASPAAAAASPPGLATPLPAPQPAAAPTVSPASEGGAHLAAIECLLTASPDLALALMLAGGGPEAAHAGEGTAAHTADSSAEAAGTSAAAAAAAAPAASPAPAAKARPRTKAALRAAAQQRAEKRGEKRQRLSNVTLSEPDAAGEEEEAAEAAAAAAGDAAAAAAAGGEAAAAPAERKPRPKKPKKAPAPLGPRRYVCSDITMEILEREGCFDMTEWDATRHLGFGSATVLKKLVLPRLGMKVWPYRKRATMKGIREGLEAHLEAHGHHADQDKVAQLLTQVRAAEQHVRDNPKMPSELSKEMTSLRQRIYKLRNEEKSGVLTADKWPHQINMLVNNTLRDFEKAAEAAAEGGEAEGEGEEEAEGEEEGEEGKEEQ